MPDDRLFLQVIYFPDFCEKEKLMKINCCKNVHEDIQYRKVPKFSDDRKLCCNQPKIQTKKPNLRVIRQKMQKELQTV